MKLIESCLPITIRPKNDQWLWHFECQIGKGWITVAEETKEDLLNHLAVFELDPVMCEHYECMYRTPTELQGDDPREWWSIQIAEAVKVAREDCGWGEYND